MAAPRWLRNWLIGNDIDTPVNGWFNPMSLSASKHGHDIESLRSSPLLLSVLSIAANYLCNARFSVRDSEGVEIEGHPLAELISQPNPLQTQREYIRSWFINIKLYGAAWINSLGGIGFMRDPSRTSLVVLPCVYITDRIDVRQVALDESILERLHFYYGSHKGTIELTYDELMYSVDLTSPAIDPFEFISPAQAAATIASNNNLRIDADNILTGKPGGLGIISTKPSVNDGVSLPLKPSEKKRVEQRMKRYGVGYGKQDIIVSDASLQWQSIAQTIKDFDLTAGDDRDYRAICNLFQVPKDLVLKDSTYENYRYAQIDYYQNAASNMAQIFCDTHNSYFGMEGEKLTYSFDHVPVMADVKKSQAEYKITMAEFYEKAAALGADQSIIAERITELL